MDIKVAELLNKQISKEFYSAYLYLSISNYYYSVNLDGFGNWYNIQAKEEVDHGARIVKYLNDRDQKITMDAIDAPKSDFANFREPIELALKHELYISGLINNLYGVARDARDYPSCQFLDWYLAEQVEEEKNANDLLAKYDLSGGEGRGLLLLDEFLTRRQYQPLV